MNKISDLNEQIKNLEKEKEFYKNSLDELNSQFHEKIRELSVIRKIGDRLKISMSIEQACKNIVSIVLNEINADSCSLMLYDEENDKLILKSVKSQKEDKAKYFGKNSDLRTFKMGEGIAGKAAKAQVVFRINDTALESNFIPNYIATADIKSIICLPLISRDKTLGVLNLSHSQTDAFTDRDERILNILANQISSSLSNLIYSQELVSVNKELKNTLKELKSAQKELFNHSKNLEKMVEDKTRELNKKNIELKKQYEKVSEIDRLKSEFLSLISSELKNPLNSIMGFSNILIEQQYGKLNIKQLKFIENIVNSSRQLANKIEMLIELSKIEAGKAELVQEEANLNLIINDVLDSFESDFKKHKIKLKKTFDKGAKIIRVDIKKLAQILKNIISNSIKFSKEKGTIEIITENIVEEGAYKISIIDEGISVHENYRKRFLEPFSDPKENLNVTDDDTSVGFVLTKRLVELMGGKVRFGDEHEDKKTIISIILPVKGVEEVNTILIADDDIDILGFLKILFESEDFKVHTAINGEEVLDFVEKNIPDLIITDIAMPKINVYDVIKSLKDNKRTKDIPIIVLSGQIDLDAEKLFKLGVDEFISKPFSNTVLLNIVRRLILHRKLSKI